MATFNPDGPATSRLLNHLASVDRSSPAWGHPGSSWVAGLGYGNFFHGTDVDDVIAQLVTVPGFKTNAVTWYNHDYKNYIKAAKDLQRFQHQTNWSELLYDCFEHLDWSDEILRITTGGKKRVDQRYVDWLIARRDWNITHGLLDAALAEYLGTTIPDPEPDPLPDPEPQSEPEEGLSTPGQRARELHEIGKEMLLAILSKGLIRDDQFKYHELALLETAIKFYRKMNAALDKYLS